MSVLFVVRCAKVYRRLSYDKLYQSFLHAHSEHCTRHTVNTSRVTRTCVSCRGLHALRVHVALIDEGNIRGLIELMPWYLHRRTEEQDGLKSML